MRQADARFGDVLASGALRCFRLHKVYFGSCRSTFWLECQRAHQNLGITFILSVAQTPHRFAEKELQVDDAGGATPAVSPTLHKLARSFACSTIPDYALSTGNVSLF